jgi:hypothetical protein
VRRLFFRRLPFFKLLAIGEVLLLARRHLRKLPPGDRRRLTELVRRGHRLTQAERDELRALLSRLEPGLFAGAALDRFSPVPLPRRFTRGR